MAMNKRGRSVARLPAVMARPCSTVDQMAISSVDPGRISFQRCRPVQVLTKKVGRVEKVDKGQTRNDSSTGNAAHCDQGDQSNLCPPLQLQMPDHKGWDNGKRKIRNDAEDAVDIAKDGDDSIIDAFPLLRDAVPHVRDGVALEETDKEKGTSGNDRDQHGHVDNPVMIISSQYLCRQHHGHSPRVEFPNADAQ